MATEEDEMFPIHKIHDNLMPAVVYHMSKLKIAEADKSVRKFIDWINNDLVDVNGALRRLKETERLLNVQMKELVCVLNDISKAKAGMDSMRLESEQSIGQRRMKKEVSKLKKVVTKLKETVNLNGSFNLHSYVESKDEMLAIHKIDRELMPVVLNHVSKLKSSIPETRREELKDLDGFRNDLLDARDAIGKLNEAERLVNDRMKELVRINLDDISNEINATAEGRQSAALIEFMGLEYNEFFCWDDDSEAEPSEEESVKSKSGEISYSLNNPKSSELTIHPDQIQNELDQLHGTLPKLRHTLTLIPRVLPSAHILQVSPSANVANVQPPLEAIEGTTNFTSFVKSLDTSLHSTMPLYIFKDFQVLYDSLDDILKLCLLCFSAFPDNSVINKRVLIYWWIGEGFIESLDRGGKTAESTANEILNALVAKGFIEPVYRKRHPVVHRYRMHPLIRFMVVVLARKAKFFDIDDAGCFVTNTDVSKTSLKACLVRTEEGSSQHMLGDGLALKKLDTLFNVNESYLDLQSHWFAKLEVVRILQLGRWQSSIKHHIEVSNTDFLKSLSNMKCLRYLSLQGISRIPELPVSFSNLTNMKVLNLRACHNLQKLPDGIGKLKNLTHLDISECYLIVHMPQELALLTQLQVLKGFVICDLKSVEHDVCRLIELSHLKKLRKLSLYVSGEPNDTKSELFDSLPHFTALLSLTITWVGDPLLVTPRPPVSKGFDTTKPRSKGRLKVNVSTTTNNVIKSLENLEKLDLRCFPWTRMDGLLESNKLTKLKKLYIRGGELCSLQHMDTPWCVEILCLKYLLKVGMSWEKLQNSFPHLTYLEKVGCPNLSLFPCDGSGAWTKKLSNSN